MYRNTKHTILFPLLIASGIAAGLWIGQLIGRSNVDAQLRGMALPSNKLTYTMALIEREYVDSISMDSLSESVLPLLVKELDPHSVYIPASEMQRANESLEGEFDGIGVIFNMATDTVIVLNVIASGPSDIAGVRNGDRIIMINDTLVAGQKIPQDNIVKQLRGQRGTKVKLSLERQGIDDLVNVEVTRGIIPIKSIDAAFMLTDRIGYIKLLQFAQMTYIDILKAIGSLKKQGMKELVLDLRGNTGGYLDQAILLANEFLPKDQLIVYTEDRAHIQQKEYSNGNGTAQDIELAILIDEGSASSSEILAGAVQDNDRGTIIGRRSFGKGLVQRQIPYKDGSALRLTTARYYTPTGRSIQKPYTKGDGQMYESEILERYKHNEFFSADSIHFADSLKRITPKGKVVYGGGGIMPDIFIPADTSDVTKYFIEVVGRNILYRYTIEYADKHRKELDNVNSIAELKSLLDNDKNLISDFINYAAHHGISPVQRDIAKSRKLIEAQLRAYIGRNTKLEDNGFYSNIYPVDNVITKAIEILQKE